ncbi:MAG: site-2 protease family protein [Candidatus Micrarchaeia archaeon]
MAAHRKNASAKLEIEKKPRILLSIAVGIAAVAIIAYLYFMNAGALLRWAYALLALVLTGEAIRRINRLNGSFGAYMLGGRHGIDFIDRLSRSHKGLWIALAEWGLTVSFGIFAYPFFRRFISKKVFALGLITIVVFLLFILPYLSISMGFLNIPSITGKINGEMANSTMNTGVNVEGIALDSLSFVGGFATFTFVSILYNAGSILYSTFFFVSTVVAGAPNNSLISSQIPGIAPVLPGLTMPLFAGIVSLVILLVVHEFSHGVLARIANVKLKSVGVLLFGIIPMGAFVEPDEKEMKKLSKEKQDRMLIAGISSNMLFSIFFFLIMLVLLFNIGSFCLTSIMVTATVPGYPANGIIAPGSRVISWNGYSIKNFSSFDVAAAGDKPFSTVSVKTNLGSYSFKTGSSGKIGVLLSEEYVPIGILGSLLYFIFTVAALSFMLNFLVAVVNLLPIPGFDGWRIYDLEFKNKLFIKALAVAIVVALLINLLPWAWTA